LRKVAGPSAEIMAFLLSFEKVQWPMTDEIHGNSPDGLNFEQWLKSQKGWKFQINLVFEKGPKFKINRKFRLAVNFKCWSMMQKSLMTWFE
jgi:hypothetical protein